jgi:hypothetical protein
MGKPIRPSPTNPISGIAASYPARLAGHGAPSRIWMLSGSKVSSDCVQVRSGQW